MKAQNGAVTTPLYELASLIVAPPWTGMWNSSLDFSCQSKPEPCLLGPSSGGTEPECLPTPGFGLDPKSGSRETKVWDPSSWLTAYSSCKLPCLQTQWTLTENSAVDPSLSSPIPQGFPDTCWRWRGQCEEAGEVVGTRSYLRLALRSHPDPS